MLPRTARLLAAILLALATAAPSLTQDRPKAPPAQARIDDAIDRGLQFLLDRQELDGSWRPDEERYVAGQTGLSLYTLSKGGLAPGHPAIQRGLAFLREQPPRWTYGIAVCVMAVDAIDPPDANALVADWIERLLDAQGTGFSYPGGHEDLSLTQYGCLALRIAEKRGLKVDVEVWEDVLDFAERTSDETGAYSYRPGTALTGSMTAAGIAVMAIARDALDARGKLRKGELRRIDERIEEGVRWLGENLDPHKNPDPKDPNAGHTTRWKLYYLYGLERVGGLLDRAEFAGRNWYAEAATELVDTQNDKGAWGSPYGEPHPGTCFGVLVLKRATAPTSGSSPKRARSYGDDDPARPASLRASGDTPLVLWISSFGDAACEKHEWDGERGKGPRVTRVEYVDVGANRVLTTVHGSGEKPAAGERFAARLSLPEPGRFRVQARVYVRPFGASPSEEEILLTQEIEVRVDGVLAAGERLALGDVGRNAFRRTKVEAESSSAHGNHRAERLVDGLAAFGWLAEGNDAEPWLELDLGRPQKGSKLAFTPYVRAQDEPDAWGRPTRIRVFLNRRELGEFDVPADAGTKLYVDLKKRTTVRLVRVEILGHTKGKADADLRGFAEIELLDTK